MKKNKLLISTYDKQRLDNLLADARAHGQHSESDLHELAAELDQAKIVEPKKLPASVVTMNSRILLRDVETQEEKTYSLVFPKDADVATGAISVLAPLGTAILGYSEGDELEWLMPSGRKRRFRIEKILYQPEATGEFRL